MKQRVALYRIVLADKFKAEDGEEKHVTVTLGDPWPGPDGKPQQYEVPDALGNKKSHEFPAKVTAIFFKPTDTRTTSWVEKGEKDEKGKESPPVTVSEATSVPGHYEVWAWPDKESILEGAGVTRCLRFQPGQVISAEEEWPCDVAHKYIRSGYEDLVIDEVDEDEETEAQDNGSASATA